ncbi:TetR family transcriptional regulator [Bradyrhizobium yuanmingense]|uniref:TetR/AcrR family transcriptional regulator n=1 Tax=Bradyrhizobium yuanmingense TaxID=108015 RepID=UPI0012FB19FA|nr:TetR/AcrR family transcriptional regulator [Bradyrhizobium yuanmingense]MVT51196.1 TetR family transcriptional regulator [Bradyrhizobium yuanmingense]
MVQKAANARERFEKAAVALFQERGYVGTTVPEIAARAGLTERTFYRYFTDKREVFFWRADEHRDRIVNAIARAPRNAHPLTAVTHAFETVGAFIDGHRTKVKLRQAFVSAHTDFQEREMMKLRALASAIETALQERGVSAPSARMISEVAVAIWSVALERWSSDEAERNFAHHVQNSFAELQMVVIEHGSERHHPRRRRSIKRDG